MKRVWIAVAALALIAWARTAVYTVDYTEFVYVTRFGERVADYDGESAAGLRLKAPWPIDAVQRIDRRVQAFDLPVVETLTRDPGGQTVDKTLSVDGFVTWRVADVRTFVEAQMSPEQVRKVLGPLVSGRLAAALSTMPLDELISVAEAPEIDARAERVRRRMLGEDGAAAGVREQARKYGVEVVDVRVRRFSFPEAVRRDIAERIRSERGKKVAEYESEARVQAGRITTDAQAAARRIEDQAAAEKTRVEGEAKADAARIRAAAYAADREFGLFLEQLQAVQATVAETRDFLVLSTNHPLYKLWRELPGGVKNEK